MLWSKQRLIFSTDSLSHSLATSRLRSTLCERKSISARLHRSAFLNHPWHNRSPNWNITEGVFRIDWFTSRFSEQIANFHKAIWRLNSIRSMKLVVLNLEKLRSSLKILLLYHFLLFLTFEICSLPCNLHLWKRQIHTFWRAEKKKAKLFSK